MVMRKREVMMAQLQLPGLHALSNDSKLSCNKLTKLLSISIEVNHPSTIELSMY
jgi:hypothetical protein